MAVLKLVKNLFYAFCILVILLCALVVWAAFSPTATERLASILYGENRDQGIVDVVDRTDPQQPGSDGDNQPGALTPQESPEPTIAPAESPEPTIAPPQMDGPLIWEPKTTPQPSQTQSPNPAPDFDPNGMVINIYVSKNGNAADAAATYVIPSSDSVEAPKDLAD